VLRGATRGRGDKEADVKKSAVLRKAIMERRAVVVPGAHDAFSAKVIEKCGFEAIQVSGYGVAGSLLGKPDVGLVQMKDVLDMTWNIAQAVGIPVMADVDTGGGNAVNAAWIAERLIAMGVAGMNIEDQVFPKRCGHMAGKEVPTRPGHWAWTRPSGAATSTSTPGPTWASSTASAPAPTWSARSKRSRARCRSTSWMPSAA
jgi:isocitrate lyase